MRCPVVRRAPYAAVGFAVVSVSFSSIFILWSASPPVTIALYRLAIASAILAPVAAFHPSQPLRGVTRRDAGLMVLVGLVLAAHFGLWITSLRMTSVASSTILVTSHPLLVGLVSHFGLGERLAPRASAGIVLGFVGVVGLALVDSSVSGETLSGDALAFLGGVMAGAYFLLGRRLRQRVRLLGYALVVYASAALFLLLFAVAVGEDLAPPGDVPREFGLFLAMALVPQIGGHTMYNWALRWVGAPLVSLSLVGEPIGSSLLAWALLGQVPANAGAVALAGVLALVGIYLAGSAEGPRGRIAGAPRDAG